MLKSDVKLGAVFGITIGIHYSWFLIALLIVFSFSANFRATFPGMGGPQIVLLAVATALLFFISLLAHELSHSLVAKSRGIPVKEITLFALGGVSQLEGETVAAKDEFNMAAAGPLASVAIGLTFLGLAFVFRGPEVTPVTALMSLLGYINVALAVFNLIPGYPLDGGRILRAALWWKWGDLQRATQTAAKIGQAVGFGFIVLGVAAFFSGSGIGGLWIAFIGWFLVQAAGASYLEVGMKQALAGVQVKDLMRRDCPTVERNMNLQDLIDSELLRTGRRCFVVVDRGQVAGLVTPKEIATINRSMWPLSTVDQAMKTLEDLRTIAPETSATDALKLLGSEDINQLPVVKNGKLEGVLTRADVLNYLQTAMELHGLSALRS